ncbi:MAG: ATP-binding protein [Planctomycetaceae bacterium]
MITKPVDSITKADIDALIASRASEIRTMEFKEILPGRSDSDKREFLADAASFANSNGGDIIYGIRAVDGNADCAVGVGVADIDSEILRLESIIRDGIEPRIAVQTHHVEGFPSGAVIVMRISKSWAPPHMVTFGGASRFFGRDSRGKYQMDVGQIRNAFAMSESLADRVRQFRLDRLSKLLAGESPIKLPSQAFIAVHLVPLSAFGIESSLPTAEINKHKSNFAPIRFPADSSRPNLDGFLMAAPGPDRGGIRYGYCQVFRSGIIEAVDGSLIERNEPRIPSWTVEEQLVKSVSEYLVGFNKLGVTPPIVAMLSIFGAKGLELAHPGIVVRFERTAIDRDNLLLPDVMIEDLSLPAATVLRPAFDAMWNAAGWMESPYYDENGSHKYR